MSIGKSVPVAILWAAISVAALGQGATSPSQPQDPTATAPATTPGGAPPATEQIPPSQNSEKTSTDSTAQRRRTFTGTVVRHEDNYSLRNGDREYKLDNPEAAKEYEGQKVKVRGVLDEKNAEIRVQSIKKTK